jgi:hypothetical protein
MHGVRTALRRCPLPSRRTHIIGVEMWPVLLVFLIVYHLKIFRALAQASAVLTTVRGYIYIYTTHTMFPRRIYGALWNALPLMQYWPGGRDLW